MKTNLLLLIFHTLIRIPVKSKIERLDSQTGELNQLGKQ